MAEPTGNGPGRAPGNSTNQQTPNMPTANAPDVAHVLPIPQPPNRIALMLREPHLQVTQVIGARPNPLNGKSYEHGYVHVQKQITTQATKTKPSQEMIEGPRKSGMVEKNGVMIATGHFGTVTPFCGPCGHTLDIQKTSKKKAKGDEKGTEEEEHDDEEEHDEKKKEDEKEAPTKTTHDFDHLRGVNNLGDVLKLTIAGMDCSIIDSPQGDDYAKENGLDLNHPINRFCRANTDYDKQRRLDARPMNAGAVAKKVIEGLHAAYAEFLIIRDNSKEAVDMEELYWKPALDYLTQAFVDTVWTHCAVPAYVGDMHRSLNAQGVHDQHFGKFGWDVIQKPVRLHSPEYLDRYNAGKMEICMPGILDPLPLKFPLLKAKAILPVGETPKNQIVTVHPSEHPALGRDDTQQADLPHYNHVLTLPWTNESNKELLEAELNKVKANAIVDVDMEEPPPNEPQYQEDVEMDQGEGMTGLPAATESDPAGPSTGNPRQQAKKLKEPSKKPSTKTHLENREEKGKAKKEIPKKPATAPVSKKDEIITISSDDEDHEAGADVIHRAGGRNGKALDPEGRKS